MTIRYKLLFFSLVLLSIFTPGHAQVQVKITKGEKRAYNRGDEICLSVNISVDPQTCRDGMNQVKFYPSGLVIKETGEWNELEKGLWQKDLMCIIQGNKKGYGQLTIMRRVDKQSFVHQEKFNLIK
jgi:hypothetical protein